MKTIINIYCGSCYGRKNNDPDDLYFNPKGGGEPGKNICVQLNWNRFVASFERWMDVEKVKLGQLPF